MRYLTDSREPITLDDIYTALEDHDRWLDEDPQVDTQDLIARLAAIVELAYGRRRDV